MTKYYKNFILFAVSYYTIFFFFYSYLLEFSPHYIVPFLSTNVITANAFVSGRFRSRCRYFVGLRCLRSPERALQNATWKDVWKMRGVKNTYHPLMLLSILPICSERAARKYASLSGLIINNCHRCMLTHIDWYACGCLLLIFRESALVKHSFYEKLSDWSFVNKCKCIALCPVSLSRSLVGIRYLRD